MFYVSLCIIVTSLKRHLPPDFLETKLIGKTNRHSIANNLKWLLRYINCWWITISNYSYSSFLIKQLKSSGHYFTSAHALDFCLSFFRLLMSLSKEGKKLNGELPYPVAFWWFHCLIDNFINTVLSICFPLITCKQLKIQ